MIADLPEDYYRNNFLTLLEEVSGLYADLLSAEETAFQQQFFALSDDAQKLYVRLLMRKGPLFRSDSLHYREIADLPGAALELADRGFLSINPAVPLNVLLNLLKNSELCDLAALDRKLRRPAILEAALQADHDWPALIATQFSWYLPLRYETFQSFLLFFFGNLYQDLTEFVLSDLQHVRFEAYRIDQSQRFFRHREDWQDYYSYYQARATWDLIDSSDTEQIRQCFALLPLHSDAPLLQEKLHRFALAMARQLERLQQYDSALEIYARIPLVAALERRARIHYQRGDIELGMALCIQITRQSAIDEELQFAHRFYQKLAREIELQQPLLRALKRRRSKAVEIIIRRDQPDTAYSVEELARQYYAGQKPVAACHYVENSLFNALFGLAFWDIIFANVAGVFLNPFQQAPKDIFSPYFCQRRQQIISERLTRLQTQGVSDIVLEHFVSKFGIANRFVNWTIIDEDLLQRCFKHIPDEHLIAVFKHMLKDLRHYRRGFPDLVLFYEDGGYKLIEIKGPGDRLQAHQSAWMKQFADIGIPHQLVNVKWRESVTADCQENA